MVKKSLGVEGVGFGEWGGEPFLKTKVLLHTPQFHYSLLAHTQLGSTVSPLPAQQTSRQTRGARCPPSCADEHGRGNRAEPEGFTERPRGPGFAHGCDRERAAERLLARIRSETRWVAVAGPALRQKGASRWPPRSRGRKT